MPKRNKIARYSFKTHRWNTICVCGCVGFRCVCVCMVFIMKRKTITWIGTACDFNDLGEYAKFSCASHILRENSFHLQKKYEKAKQWIYCYIHHKCSLWLRLFHIHDNWFIQSIKRINSHTVNTIVRLTWYYIKYSDA